MKPSFPVADASRRARGGGRRLDVDPAKKTVRISKLFESDWYAKDVVSDPSHPAAKPELYLLARADGDAKRVLASGGYAVGVIEWNWTLNEKRQP